MVAPVLEDSTIDVLGVMCPRRGADADDRRRGEGDHGDGGAESFAFEGAGEDFAEVGFLAWGDDFALAGAAKVRGKILSSAITDEINDAIQTGRLYITVSALDAQALREKKKQIVWRTRISIPSRGNWLPDAMEVMLASAAPYFGADSDMPVILREEDRRKTDVQIGEATVVDEP